VAPDWTLHGRKRVRKVAGHLTRRNVTFTRRFEPRERFGRPVFFAFDDLFETIRENVRRDLRSFDACYSSSASDEFSNPVRPAVLPSWTVNERIAWAPFLGPLHGARGNTSEPNRSIPSAKRRRSVVHQKDTTTTTTHSVSVLRCCSVYPSPVNGQRKYQQCSRESAGGRVGRRSVARNGRERRTYNICCPSVDTSA